MWEACLLLTCDLSLPPGLTVRVMVKETSTATTLPAAGGSNGNGRLLHHQPAASIASRQRRTNSMSENVCRVSLASQDSMNQFSSSAGAETYRTLRKCHSSVENSNMPSLAVRTCFLFVTVCRHLHVRIVFGNDKPS